MRQIKASEVKPGMTIRVEHLEVKHELTVSYVAPEMGTGSVEARTRLGGSIYLPDCKPVTVLSEPQPEEPTEFGARVVVNGQRLLRAPMCDGDSTTWLSGSSFKWYKWPEILAMGPVTVIPDQGWTVPDAPEVPEQADEWDTWEDVPEGVTVANPELSCRYRKAGSKNEAISPIGGWVLSETNLALWTFPGPWTRVTDV